MKHRAFTLVEFLVVMLIIGVLAAFAIPLFLQGRESSTPSPRVRCISNLKQIALGYHQYTQDYDEKLPPVKSASEGWADLLQPYLRSTQLFQCPSDKNRAAGTSDYFFNARLANVSMAKLAAVTLTISLGDGLPAQPFDAHLMQLPASWSQNANSPAYRHLDGANYAFVDGHVKWFKPQSITLDKPSANRPTFLLGGSYP